MKNAAVIFVSHSMQFVYRICTKVMVLDGGKIAHYGNDVEEGIDFYHSQFNQLEQRISGSGKAAVSDVCLSSNATDVNRNGMLSLAYGDNLVVEMNLSINTTVETPVIRVFIYNQAMQPVADCWSEQCGFNISNQPGKSTIRLTFNNLHLHAGVYSIGIAVLNLSDSEILFRSDYLAFFQVKNVSISWAPVVFPGEWEEVGSERSSSSSYSTSLRKGD
jgi:lipopolysaccharide transport system ATP-binding protein